MAVKAGKWIKQIFDNLKIKYKLLLSFLILISIPLGVLSLIIFNFSVNTLYNHVSFSAKHSFNQTYSYLSYMFDSIIDASDIIVTDSMLNEILMKNPASYSSYDQVLDMHELLKYLSSFQNNRDIYKVRLFIQSGLMYSSENTFIFDIEEIKSAIWYKKLTSSSDKVLFCPSAYLDETDIKGLGVLTMARAISNRNNYAEKTAVLRLDIDMGGIQVILNDANPTDGSVNFLMNSEGILVASSSSNELITQQATLLVQQKQIIDGEFKEIMLGKGRVMMMSRRIQNTDWTMFTVIPYDNYNGERVNLQSTLFLFLLVAVCFAYALAYMFSNSITLRIYRLIDRMRANRLGKLVNTVIENTAKDEIGELYENYNFMMERISVLIGEEYKLGQQVKNAELKALHAQINPHFLYNTLDMINWMSRMNKVSEISSVVEALANFYKLTLNKGKDIVTVRDEMKHVSYYIQIQSLRFDNQITADFDVDPAVMDTPIPKITLQSLVENAIHHGILEKESKCGHIHIEGRLEGSIVVLSVHDDGVGIPKDLLADITNADPMTESSGSHYGLKNVDLRIKLIFGEAYGLTFHSEPGKGTTVEVHLPKKES